MRASDLLTDIEKITKSVQLESAKTASQICEDTFDYMDSKGVYFATVNDKMLLRQGMREKMDNLALEIVKLVVAYQDKQKKGSKHG